MLFKDIIFDSVHRPSSLKSLDSQGYTKLWGTTEGKFKFECTALIDYMT